MSETPDAGMSCLVLSLLWGWCGVGGVGGVFWCLGLLVCSCWGGVVGVWGLLFEICIVDASIFVVLFVRVFFVLTSYEGHMVDALASRADEGRWSLR